MATTTIEIAKATEIPSQHSQEQIEEFVEMITERLPSLYQIALRRLGNSADAEDAVQNALLSAYRHLHQFKREAKLSSWVTAIVINSAGMIVRRRLRQLHSSFADRDHEHNYYSLLEALPDSRLNPEEVLGGVEIECQLEVMSKRLSPTLRRAFELRYTLGLSVREMARELRISEGAAKSQLSRVRQKLKILCA